MSVTVVPLSVNLKQPSSQNRHFREKNVLCWQLIRPWLNVSSPPVYKLSLPLLLRLWWSRISFSNNKWNHPPFPIISFPPSFSSLHYAGSLTLFDRMCYLQPPAAVPHHYRYIAGSLTPLLPATAEQGGNDDAAVWGKKDRTQSTYTYQCFGIKSVFLHGGFWHSCLPNELQLVELTLSGLCYISFSVCPSLGAFMGIYLLSSGHSLVIQLPFWSLVLLEWLPCCLFFHLLLLLFFILIFFLIFFFPQ